MNSKQNKKNFKKRRKLNPKFIFSVKVILIIILILGLYYKEQSFSNTISLLAVSENSKGNITSGSIIDLKLRIKAGSGKTYVSLNSIEEVDTQISIINSQKIACELFDLDCQDYDFYYEFEGPALVLKGPSASSAIAIITAKSIRKEKIDKSTVITGSLNSGGLIGDVGGVKEKIKVAKQEGFKKVIIPLFSEYSENNSGIEVVKVLDIVEAYNEFNGDKYKLNTFKIDKSDYEILMKKLADFMCDRANELENRINKSLIEKNSSTENFFIQAKKSQNSSKISYDNQNFYSAGSFCFNANINYRNIIEIQNNFTLEQIENQIEILKKNLDFKYNQINSPQYKQNIKTINDFYSYLIINDRLDEARKIIEDSEKIKYKQDFTINVINNINDTNNNTFNITNENIINNINKSYENLNYTNKNLTSSKLDNIKSQKRSAYAYADERFYTEILWEEFISNSGTKIKFNEQKIDDACFKINKQIQIKTQLLTFYGVNYLNKEIQEQLEYKNPFKNKYLCIYKGLQLNGKINTILNSAGIENNQSKEYAQKIVNFTQNRISLNSNGDFPLIPFIYSEYANDLIKEENLASSMLYSNFALSYLDLNLLLEKDNIQKSYFNVVVNKIFNNYLFLVCMLILIGFIS